MSFRRRTSAHASWRDVQTRCAERFAAAGIAGDVAEDRFFRYCQKGTMPDTAGIAALSAPGFAALAAIVDLWHPDMQDELEAFWKERLRRPDPGRRPLD